MIRPAIELPVLTCSRCGHTWTPRLPWMPVRCAKCKTPYWQTPPQPSPSRAPAESAS